ncbi:MAG: rRNA maturation RNase YbeY [Acholeplasma sp.]|nr:rRNA maturation RNase YbeY [Acholeplasma sp.]
MIKELEKVNELISYAVKREKLENAIFNVIIVDNNKIHELNKEYRGIDRVTDVISFALEDFHDIDLEIRMLGDIYISYEKAKEQADYYGHSYLRELSFLTIHGLLHLLGYDHMKKEDEEIMFKKQEVILNEFGISK